jgi:A/G-specific adenine glycosylase
LTENAPASAAALSAALLAWFDQNRRSLPFRQDPTPYHIWLSEIMLQQTRMSAVLPYYERFLAACPDIPALAACGEEPLHKLWEGLGYYSRVRNLQKAARIVCERYGGALPADYAALLALPGIGAYTAGAIASIGFGIPVPAVDGNVLRVLARLDNDARCVSEPAAKAAFTARAAALQPPDRPGDFNQALMELGALVCVPNGAPLCAGCPWAAACRARAAGTEARLPVKLRPKARRIVPVAVALVKGPEGWLLHRRPETGLLAGLWEPPAWEDKIFSGPAEMRAALAARGIAACGAGEPLPAAKHIFTHLEWRLSGWRFSAQGGALPEGWAWATPAQLAAEYTLPGAFSAYRACMFGQAPGKRKPAGRL